MTLTPFLATDRVVWWLTRHYPTRTPATEVRPKADTCGAPAPATGMPLVKTILGEAIACS